MTGVSVQVVDAEGVGAGAGVQVEQLDAVERELLDALADFGRCFSSTSSVAVSPPSARSMTVAGRPEGADEPVGPVPAVDGEPGGRVPRERDDEDVVTGAAGVGFAGPGRARRRRRRR